MKVYAQFLTDNLRGHVVTALGSDGVFILDGRNNLNTQINDAWGRRQALINVHPDYFGFQIVRANSFSDDGSVLFRTHELGNPVVYNLYSENTHTGERTYFERPDGGRALWGYVAACDQVRLLNKHTELKNTRFGKVAAS